MLHQLCSLRVKLNSIMEKKKKEGGGKKISFRRYLSVTALGPIEKAWHGQKEKPERRNKAEQ